MPTFRFLAQAAGGTVPAPLTPASRCQVWCQSASNSGRAQPEHADDTVSSGDFVQSERVERLRDAQCHIERLSTMASAIEQPGSQAFCHFVPVEASRELDPELRVRRVGMSFPKTRQRQLPHHARQSPGTREPLRRRLPGEQPEVAHSRSPRGVLHTGTIAVAGLRRTAPDRTLSEFACCVPSHAPPWARARRSRSNPR